MKNISTLLTPFPTIIILGSGAVATTIGFVALLGWVLGLPLLASRS